MNVQAIILAAGTGSRLGRISKPLLKISGKTLLRRQIESLEQSGIANIMVVTGFESEKLVLELSNTSVATIHNPAFENGNHQHSLELAVRALPLDSSDIVIICLADQVLVDSKAIAALLQNYAKHPESITLIPKNSLDAVIQS
jgi:molybdenum cofactor cytidylyltransferase